MESWGYVSRGKEFAPNGTTLSSSDAISRSKNAFLNWELRSPSSFSNDMFDPSELTSNDAQGFGGLGFQYMSNQVSSSDTMKDMFCHKIGHGRDSSLITTTPNAFMGEGESSSKFFSSGLGLNKGDSPLIDLKLGRFGDQGNVHDVRSSNGNGASILSSFVSSTPLKRVRAGGVNAQTAYCQVYGCNKDLSSSKDYHKRHKVCEVHTKTPKVIVNGIDQRFCQQCSRFHLLAEFDGGKRSCRKRLAGHNERRRKPQISAQSGKATRMLQTCHGSRFKGNVNHVKTPFICPDILPEGKFSHPQKDLIDKGCRRIKNEDGTGFSTQSASLLPTKYQHSRSSLPPFHYGKPYPCLDSGGENSVTGSILCDGSRYPNDMGISHSSSLSLFQSASLGSEVITIFDTASTLPGLSAISDSGCALSLLSSQSLYASTQICGTPMDQSLAMPGGHFQLSASPVSKYLMGSSSRASRGGVSRKTSSPESSCPGSSFISSSETVTFEVSDGHLQGSDFLNARNDLCGDGTTINLLQLSSQLQRVEHQRQSSNVKPSNDAVFSLEQLKWSKHKIRSKFTIV